LPPFLQRWFDKKTRRQQLRFRKRGHKSAPLRGPIGSDEFWQDYNVALKGKVAIGAELRSTAGSLSAAIAAYYASHDWNDLAEGTRVARRAVLERLREKYGQWPLRQISENFIDAYLTTLTAHAARNHAKALRGLLRHAKCDVMRNITLPKAKSNKHRSWTPAIMAQFEAAHPIGSKARLAYAFARYAGLAATLRASGPSTLSMVRSSSAARKPACLRASQWTPHWPRSSRIRR
jgi:hypothetical protein